MNCANNTFMDYLLMLIQLVAAGLVLLIAVGFLQRGIKRLGEWLWAACCRVIGRGAQ